MIYREALRKEIENNLNLLTVFRAAQAEGHDYKNVVNQMKERMRAVKQDVGEVARQNWADLKERGG